VARTEVRGQVLVCCSRGHPRTPPPATPLGPHQHRARRPRAARSTRIPAPGPRAPRRSRRRSCSVFRTPRSACAHLLTCAPAGANAKPHLRGADVARPAAGAGRFVIADALDHATSSGGRRSRAVPPLPIPSAAARSIARRSGPCQAAPRGSPPGPHPRRLPGAGCRPRSPEGSRTIPKPPHPVKDLSPPLSLTVPPPTPNAPPTAARRAHC
jgi:hypothetical protein